ncbi:Ig-like domain-containing protein [Shewanella frigidimarina]|uniref:Ig-like domain-containing protein n=1 Tax=Shewanella frigidimarina TaxID=56812 RepID=UPI003FA0D003
MKPMTQLLGIIACLTLTGCGSDSSNQAPVFSATTYNFTLDEDSSISDAVTAQDDDALTYTTASAANNGVFAINSNGSFTYTPNDNFVGTDQVTISASDNNLSSQATLIFNIENINDAPQLVTTQVHVTSSTKTEGTLVFFDADNDTVSVTLIESPQQGELILDSSTGEFIYTAASLSEIEGIFKISYTDGIIDTPIETSITLTPSYITNQDKRNYYYSSDKSHLKQAEKIALNIHDDLALEEVNEELAIGYLLAGFSEKAQTHFDNIQTLPTKARALRTAAFNYDNVGLFEQAAEYRQKAIIAYNQYIADKGFDNINSNDPTFYIAVINHYRAAGQVDQANKLLDTLKVYADTVREDEYTTTYGRFLTSFNKASIAATENYLNNNTAENKETALSMIKTYAELTAKTGYYLQKSGDYKGKPTERLQALYITWAAGLLFQINAIDEAKNYLNLALSLYGATSLDSTYSYSASPYAEATLATYPYPLLELSGLIAGLYPDVTNNPALALLTNENDIADARESMFAMQIVEAMKLGSNIDDATYVATTYFAQQQNGLRSLYESIVGSSSTNGAAIILHNQGYDELALALLQRGSNILTSEEYVNSQTLLSKITGYIGCARLVDYTVKFGGDAPAQAQKCATMITHSITESNENYTTVELISAYIDLINTYQISGDLAQKGTVLPMLEVEINRLELPFERAKYRLQALNYIASSGITGTDLTWLTTALDELKQAASDDIEQIPDILDLISGEVLVSEQAQTGYFSRNSLLNELSRHAGQTDDYASIYQTVMTRVTADINQYTSTLTASADKTLQDNMSRLIKLHVYINQPDDVTKLIQHTVNGSADQISLYKQYSMLLAAKDDFAGSYLASVDTDHDGMPNFFLANVTDAEIAASGLIADTDADADGIEDSNDPTPLGN